LQDISALVPVGTKAVILRAITWGVAPHFAGRPTASSVDIPSVLFGNRAANILVPLDSDRRFSGKFSAAAGGQAIMLTAYTDSGSWPDGSEGEYATLSPAAGSYANVDLSSYISDSIVGCAIVDLYQIGSSWCIRKPGSEWEVYKSQDNGLSWIHQLWPAPLSDSFVTEIKRSGTNCEIRFVGHDTSIKALDPPHSFIMNSTGWVTYDLTEIVPTGTRMIAFIQSGYPDDGWICGMRKYGGTSVEVEGTGRDGQGLYIVGLSDDLKFDLYNSDGTARPVPIDIVAYFGDVPLENTAPVANAGPDQSVDEGDTVTLDGSGSSDVDEDELTYLWTQTLGPDVVLSDATAESPTFTAPSVDEITDLVFSLVVNDGTDNSEAVTVTITVNPVVVPPGTKIRSMPINLGSISFPGIVLGDYFVSQYKLDLVDEELKDVPNHYGR
jgi:hypothetical protein